MWYGNIPCINFPREVGFMTFIKPLTGLLVCSKIVQQHPAEQVHGDYRVLGMARRARITQW